MSDDATTAPPLLSGQDSPSSSSSDTAVTSEAVHDDDGVDLPLNDDDYDLALSELLADVDLESLEQFVGELLPQVQGEGEEDEDETQEEREKERLGVGAGPAAGTDTTDDSSLQSPSSVQPEQEPATQKESTPGATLQDQDSFLDYDDFLYTGPSV